MDKKPPKNEKASEKDPPEGPLVTLSEQKQVEEHINIPVNVVYEAIRQEGEAELRRPVAGLAWSALAAGLSMGFSFIAEAFLMAGLPDRPWRPLISKLGYSVGFLIVVLGRQQLFTENTLTAILPFLLRTRLRVFWQVLRLWGVVLIANLVGTWLFALCVARLKLFDPRVQSALLEIGSSHTGLSFGTVYVHAVFAGWLIALMVWLLPGAESARVEIIIIVTYLVGLGGFEHIIAGSTTMLYLVSVKALSWAAYFSHFFFPTLLGNITGGVSLVAALGHAQVVGSKSPKKAKHPKI